MLLIGNRCPIIRGEFAAQGGQRLSKLRGIIEGNQIY